MTYTEWKAIYTTRLAQRISRLNEDDYDIDKIERFDPRPGFIKDLAFRDVLNSAVDSGYIGDTYELQDEGEYYPD